MDKVENKKIIHYLMKLKQLYGAIDEITLRKDIQQIEEIILTLQGIAKEAHPTKTKRNKENTFSKTLVLLNEKNFHQLKGTKINFKHVASKEDVITFFEIHSDEHILRHTTALDLKLVYTILTEEVRELKGKKEELLQTIKRNIYARKRGEAFSK
ncbi:hypothetical protein FZW96_00620 [Bacillus sp. BGMRC 2118]|nr:hypothetical protein FZW96_00620 [Bacillus sp. BGMRC 2118]